MLLFHYATQRYLVLLNQTLQHRLTEDELNEERESGAFRGDPGPYTDHISLFIEPPPLEFIHELFPKDHHTWVKGNRLFEHQVAVDSIDLYAWMVVETPIRVILRTSLPWIEHDGYKKLFFRIQRFGSRLFREQGTTKDGLKRYLTRFKPGTTRAAYERLRKKPLSADDQYTYAATVPHLMVYTHHPIPVLCSHTRRVGEPIKRTPTVEALLSSLW
jgi:hypothetical protein